MLESTFAEACEAAQERWCVPALAVGLLAPDGGVELFSGGCTPDTRFRVASITKPLTASLAVRTLDLDAATGVWPADVRVLHLLSHTSGFDCELDDLSRFGDGDGALAAAVSELPAVRRWAPAGALWSYANTGYWLAGHLAAERAGTSYEDALSLHVLAPAGLSATDFGEPDVEGTGPGAVAGPYPRARRPSGGLVSTVPDLLRFAAWHLEQRWAEALRFPYALPPRGFYGLGLQGERVGGVEVWGHGGSYGGFQSSLLVVPARRVAFVGLTNSDCGKRALREIEDVWLARVVGAGRIALPTVDVPAGDLAAVAGTYANGRTEARVTAAGARLAVELVEGSGREIVEARPVGGTAFELVGGTRDRDNLDFPRPGLARIGACLAERLP